MRSLFLKIFAFFWLSTALIIGVFIATADRPSEDEIRAAVHRGLTPATLTNAEILIHAYESGGCQAVYRLCKAGLIPARGVFFDYALLDRSIN